MTAYVKLVEGVNESLFRIFNVTFDVLRLKDAGNQTFVRKWDHKLLYGNEFSTGKTMVSGKPWAISWIQTYLLSALTFVSN